MADLNALLIFANVADVLSFSEAARRLGMPVSTVSRKVAELETQLGIRLIERSTRKLRLTDIGLEILEHATKSVDIYEAINRVVSNQSAEVYGTVRLSAPPNIATNIIAPLATAFQDEYPKVNIHTLMTNRFIDHIADGIDLTIRIGRLEDSTLIARKILHYRHRLVASPAYLNVTSAPSKPADLLDHRLCAFSVVAAKSTWVFSGKGEAQTVVFTPSLAMNDYAGLASALEAGSGIGELPPIIAPELLRDGRLVEVMPDWRFNTVDVSLVHLGNRHMSRPVRLFKAFCIERAPELFNDLPE
jgi:DNA-binding transcriptional LysR family regulator